VGRVESDSEEEVAGRDLPWSKPICNAFVPRKAPQRHASSVFAVGYGGLPHENAYAKVSEFGFKGQLWDFEYQWAVCDAIAAFGAERCMFG
jgi:hypothetical protein